VFTHSSNFAQKNTKFALFADFTQNCGQIMREKKLRGRCPPRPHITKLCGRIKQIVRPTTGPTPKYFYKYSTGHQKLTS
jgi:hypothetical protein